ncbi:MAG: DNA-protecting protein DprA [Armatimonadia bacterium]|nr:DNA-protecting protein DprA [Armatimonadia bacterium]
MRITAPQPDEQDRHAWAALYWSGRIGPAGFMRLLARFGSAGAVLSAEGRDLAMPALRLSERQIEAITTSARDHRDQVEAEVASLADDGIAVICSFQETYPAAMRDAANPPPVICVRGELTAEDTLGLAIVGTREPTPEGRAVAKQVAAACADRGLTVVSGLARGIDTEAHRGALKAGGRTVAVLGSGICCIRPKRNVRLAGQVAGSGAIISEVAPDAPPTAGRLLARNRLTSALARGVLAVETGVGGGTMQTVRDAWRQGRAVFACDWQSDRPQAEGTRALIAQGAEPILGPDAIETIAHILATHQPPPPDQPQLL